MMENVKMLTGYELVSKGTTKLEATLPEIGLKDVFPNGSWIEQKQIQAALEARKHLIEVERIEKSGVLSHAVWREEFMLAEVTQKVGGYWQYLGHNKGKNLFLNPEEALFLMEINCLHLTHNDVKVSLQQAYTLLLRGNITLLEYKVYASLSRLGYRLFRHQILETNISKNSNKKYIAHNESIDIKPNIEEDSAVTLEKDENNCEILEDLEECDTKNNPIYCDRSTMDFTVDSSSENKFKYKNICKLKRLEKLKNRKLKPCNSESLHEHFKSIPTFLNKSLVTIKVADKKYLPTDLNLSKSVYCVNLLRLQRKFESPPVAESNRYSPDDVNGSHIRRLRNTSYTSNYSNPPIPRLGFLNQCFPRPFYFWRHRSNINYFNLNMAFQRPFMPNMFFGMAPGFLPRPQQHFRQTFHQNCRNRKRNRGKAQADHLEAIKNFTTRLKNLFQNGHTDRRNVDALQKLIATYTVKNFFGNFTKNVLEVFTQNNLVNLLNSMLQLNLRKLLNIFGNLPSSSR